MKVTEKKLEDGRVLLEAVAATAEVSQALTTAQYNFLAQMGVAPVEGKTPQQLAQEQLGVKDLDAIVTKQAEEYLVPFAIDKRNLVPAYPPKVISTEPLKRGQTYSFSLRVALKPDYELSSYDPVSITVPPFTFDESEVDRQMAQLADSFATFEPCEAHPLAASDDAALIAIDATMGGETLKNLCTPGRTYVMGMQLMPPDFEQNLVGMTAGETKEFDFTFPGADAADEKARVHCSVTVKELQRKTVAEIDDEWVAKNMPLFRDAASMRAGMREQIMNGARASYNELLQAAAAQELSKRFQGRIADEVYESMRTSLMENLRAQLQQQNIPFDQYVQSQGGEQQFGMLMMMQTREMLVQGYSLDAVFRHEKLEITDDDLTAAAATMNPQNPTAARRDLEGNGRGFALREMAERMVANKFILDHATITEQAD